MAKDFIPEKDGDLAIWLGNFQTQLADLGADFGLSPSEITAGSMACTETFTKIGAGETKKNESQQSTQEKEISKKNTISLIRSYTRRIKAHPAYNRAKGQLLNIIGEDGADQDKPVYTVIITPPGVQINFTKFQFDGVNVYRRRGNETTFQKLAFDKISPYIDNDTMLVPAQSEKREYYVVGVINDVETGDASDIVGVLYGG